MMVKFSFWKTLFICCEVIVGISASTHWVVTENGRIQSQLDSPFHLRRPYDLVAFLEQDVRRNKIDTLYKELVGRKNAIDEKWSSIEGATDLETRLYQSDSDCLKAGTPLSEINLYTTVAADGNGRDGIHLEQLFEDVEEEEHLTPDCQSVIPLEFSMFCFEHLNGMVGRANISMSPEYTVLPWLPSTTNIYGFGHQVATKLARNSTSWLLHNLASIYWRMRGNAYNAIECSRRAVHFAPREFKDIALSNLANIFHQSRHPREAAIILHAAIDHDPQHFPNHFALGNVYAVLADYNRSVACFDNCLKLMPDFEKATRTKFSVLCHRRLENGLMELYESLQGILSELHDYHSHQEQWLQLQERLMWEQAPLEARLLEQNPETFSAILANRGQTCTARSGDNDRSAILSCDVNTDSQMLAHNLHIDITLSLQMLLRNVESQAQKISMQMGHWKLLKEGFTLDGDKVTKTRKVLSDDETDDDRFS